MRRILMTMLAVASVLAVAAGGAAATPAPVGPLVRVSGPSPFVDCPAGSADQLLPTGAVEPSVTVNPANSHNVVAVWTQDHFHGLVAGVSLDGGRSWRRRVVGGLTRCTGGAFDFADNATLSFGPDGVLHLAAHVFDATPTPGGGYATVPSGRLATSSADGGLTWRRPVPIVTQADPRQGQYSGGTTTVDPGHPRLVYSLVPEFPTAQTDPASFRAQVVFSRSGDGGRTWSPPRPVFDPGPARLTTGHQLQVLPDGALVDSFTLIDPGRPALWLLALRSTDRGRTWSGPTVVADLRSRGTTDPDSGDPVAGGSNLLADTAVDPASGRLYLAWQDARFTGGAADAIALASSADGGRNWTRPVRVNATPTSIPLGDQQAFTAALDVAADGTVGVSYYDLRRNDPGVPLLTDRWLVRCHPTRRAPCTTPAGFSDEVRLTSASFDLRQADRLTTIGPRGYYLGVTMGLAHAGHDFIAAFSQPRPLHPTGVYTRRISPDPGAAGGWNSSASPPTRG